MSRFAAIGLSVLCIRQAIAAPVLWSGNGNHYEFVTSTFTWDQARTAADATIFLGSAGHLATITSSAENDFIDMTFNTDQFAQFAWIGGNEPNDDGVWRWVVGPESGIQFSSFNMPTAPFNYANWGGIEPNDNNPFEDYAMFNIGRPQSGINSGQWADAQPVPGVDPVIGYLVEYETSAVPEASMFALLSCCAVGVAGLKLRERFEFKDSSRRPSRDRYSRNANNSPTRDSGQ
jgi:hypothetical protein